MTLVRPTVTGYLLPLFKLDDVHSLFAPSNKYRYNDIISNVHIFSLHNVSISIELQEICF